MPLGIKAVTDTVTALNPTLANLTPAQTTCNYLTLWFRNVASLLSEGDGNGTWQRFIIIATPQGPNNEGGPSSAPGQRARRQDNHLHINPYPNTASPGQPKECEAGNETVRRRPDRDRQRAGQPGHEDQHAGRRTDEHLLRLHPTATRLRKDRTA